MLKVQGLQAAYGESQVLHDINLEVAEGEVVTEGTVVARIEV